MLRIALAQVNATVGDLAGNAELIVEWTRRAAARGARVVVFPEMLLTGYPVEDLALRASFVEASIAALHDVAERLDAEGLGGVAVVTGYLDRRADLAPRTGLPAGAPLDAAAVLHGGRVVITSAKHHLPNYGVFDEYRYFVPGNTLPVFRLPAEATREGGRRRRHRDLRGPVAGRRPGGGLPARGRGAARGAERLALRARQGRRAARPGASGGPGRPARRWPTATWSAGRTSWSSTATRSWSRPAGELLARGPQFEEALVVADLDLPAAPVPQTADEPVDAGDGTVITIERVTLPLSGPTGTMDMAMPRRPRACPRWSGRRVPGRSGRGWPIRPRCTRRWSSGPGTTCARTGSAR